MRPSSSLLWVGSGIDASAPIVLASRAIGTKAPELLVSVGLQNAGRFVDALQGALGDAVVRGPRVGDAQVLVEKGRAVAVIRMNQRRAVVWLEPQDALGAAAILQLMTSAEGQRDGHPLFVPAIDVEIERARAEVGDKAANELAVFRGDVRAALLLSGTWASLLLPRPFVALGGVLTTTGDGERVAAFASARFAKDDMPALRARLAEQSPSPLACSLQQGAAVFTTFPVGAGLDDALAPDAPLPASDRLHQGAALALYPHPSQNAAAAASANAVLGIGQWAFVGRPKDAAASAALAQTLASEGLQTNKRPSGVQLFASPPQGGPAKRLEAMVADDAFALGLGGAPAFGRAVAHYEKRAFDAGCATQFGALSVVIDGNRLADVVRVSRETPLTRLSSRLASTAVRLAAVLSLREQGVVLGTTLKLRPPPP